MVSTVSVSPQSQIILEKRYLQKNEEGKIEENPNQMMIRVASAVSSVEASKEDQTGWKDKFLNILTNFDFVPNSPTLMNAGTGQGTLSACYVVPIEDNMDSIMTAAYDQAFIEKYGGGVGFPLSNIRPSGTPITTTQGKACGPMRVLRLLSEVGNMITQGGKRDGAHMAIMSVYHPDILEFVESKNVEGPIHNFNISVGADANFMKAVEEDHYLRLTWPLDNNSYASINEELPLDSNSKWIRARDIFSKIIHGAWLNGEPGMVWLDRINKDNATPQLGEIQATNPCGEQPLLGNESCNLGSINLGNFADDGQFDFERFRDVVCTAVRFLDDVVDLNEHPTPSTTKMNESTRKIGLGVMGWADLLVELKIRYDSEEAFDLADQIGSQLKTTADEYSSYLGFMKGNFPAFEESPLNADNGGQFSYLRNAWRLSIAPTGTISMIADCSSGIEPNFYFAWKKENMSAALEDVELYYINKHAKQFINEHPFYREYGYDNLQSYLDDGHNIEALLTDEELEYMVASPNILPTNHVKMQSIWQKYVDSGISKTINCPEETTEQEIWDSYMQAWSSDCKGITVYRSGSRDKEVVVSTNGVVNIEEDRKCLDCGGITVRIEGCMKCPACGWAAC